ncbi:MAG: ShlB/FhaC/HecB family hemolysin secretion/activation protein [Gammaproteobacteria bacterium]|nr:MAG: ShlB/FhaC/HecB family hemolysin secretion/activation protein [Gammaproteobacteria bacterium]
MKTENFPRKNSVCNWFTGNLLQVITLPALLLILLSPVALADDNSGSQEKAAQSAGTSDALSSEKSPSKKSSSEEDEQTGGEDTGDEDTEEEPPKFDLWEFRVTGNTLLEKRDIELVLYPFLGRNKDKNTVEMAKKALQSRYEQAGFSTIIVTTPPQDGAGGILRLNVTEGKVGRVRVVDSDYFLLSRIKNEVPALAKGRVPHLPTVNKQLMQLNGKTPDRIVRPYMKQGKKPGTVDFDLKVTDKFPLHGEVELNDQYSDNTEKLRLSAMLRYTNLWQKEHSASIQYMTTPEDFDQINIISATYMFKPDLSDNYHVFYAVDSQSGVATLGDFGQSLSVNGDGQIFGYRRITPFMPVNGLSHSLTLGLDYKDFVERISSTFSAGGSSSVTAEETPIDYLMFSVNYSATQRRDRSSTTFKAGTSFGVRGLLNEQEEFEDKRFMGQPNFLLFKGGVTHTQQLIPDLAASAGINVQVADSPLVSNERQSIGGVSTVRGYTESQISGDDALFYRLNIEWNLRKYPQWDALDQLSIGLFSEGGKTRERKPIPLAGESVTEFEIHSSGINMQFAAWRQLALTLDWATPLKESGSVEKGESRTHFSLRYMF